MVMTCDLTYHKKITWVMRIGPDSKTKERKCISSAKGQAFGFGFGSPTCGHSHRAFAQNPWIGSLL
ncbi:hypothetical protein Csa_000680 [Cucumis sativus]|uniref:Uncharacterized protein n=1 Tax=Cucumis sativus TaxID=3659 RepID=A0A0A0KR43_CUCSA|nr:hypothetical protein Csa_000680 [Cucumis sativus]